MGNLCGGGTNIKNPVKKPSNTISQIDKDKKDKHDEKI